MRELRSRIDLSMANTVLEHFPITLTSPGRHGRAWPGHPRLDRAKDVDARPKAGHDGVKSDSTKSENALAISTSP
jgi:hypothetical protein